VSFDAPVWLLVAPLIGGGLASLGAAARRARLRATALWSPAAGGSSVGSGRATPWLFGAAGVLAGVALAGPRWGRSVIEVEGRSLNLVIAVDISRSMLAEDAVPSRLQRAVAEARRVVQDARGDRLALLAFAGRSYILAPLTLDDAAVTLQLEALDPDIASEGGTELAAALAQGGEVLGAAAERGARVMVVFSDGETHGPVDQALAAARGLRQAGVTVVMVGEGDTLAARIPLRDERGALLGYQTDPDGQIVRTWRRDNVLRRVADAAGGVLISATAADQAGSIRRILEGLERSPSRQQRREDLAPRGWLFGLGALALFGLQAVLRRGPAIAAIGLFLLPVASMAQRPSLGDLLLRRNDTAAAAGAYAREAARGMSPDTAYFNAGTSALFGGRMAEAQQWLELPARSLDPDLRFRALFNLGLAALQEARRDPARREELNREATGRFREALLLRPGSFDAKWNLELVQGPLPPPSSGAGGGEGRTPPPPPQTPPQPRPSGGVVSPADAEGILNSVERAEREARSEQARRRRLIRAAVARDW